MKRYWPNAVTPAVGPLPGELASENVGQVRNNRPRKEPSHHAMKNLPEIDSFSITPSIADVNPFPDTTHRSTIRVLSLLEGSTVSGPAKNLFEFCRAARTLPTGPVVDITVVTFHRSLSLDCSRNTDLIEAAQQADIAVERLPERFVFDVFGPCSAILPKQASTAA